MDQQPQGSCSTELFENMVNSDLRDRILRLLHLGEINTQIHAIHPPDRVFIQRKINVGTARQVNISAS